MSEYKLCESIDLMWIEFNGKQMGFNDLCESLNKYQTENQQLQQENDNLISENSQIAFENTLLMATNQELLEALENAMAWNWLEDELPPKEVREMCDKAYANAKQVMGDGYE